MGKSFVALALAMLAPLAWADALRTGTLTLDMPASWHFKGSSGQRAEGQGPDGEHVIVMYRVLHPGAPADVVAQHWVVIRNVARDEMPVLASGGNAQVLRAVTESPLKDARVEYSSVSKRSRGGRDGYFLQYLLGSSRTIAYFTVEGVGDATQAAARFEKILATQRWQE